MVVENILVVHLSFLQKHDKNEVHNKVKENSHANNTPSNTHFSTHSIYKFGGSHMNLIG